MHEIVQIFLLVYLLCFWGVPTRFGYIQKDAWKSIKNEDGIKVYSSKDKIHGYREFKGVAKIKSNLASVLSVMETDSLYTNWLHFCKGAFTIKKNKNAERFLYFVYDLPFVSDRDVIARSCAFISPNDSSLTIKLVDAALNEIPGLPVKPNCIRESKVVNIKALDITWQFVPIEGDSIEVIYRIYLDPALSIWTKWRFDAILEKLVFETLKKFRKQINSPDYRIGNQELLKEVPIQESCL